MIRCARCDAVLLEGAKVCPSCKAPIKSLSNDAILEAYELADKEAQENKLDEFGPVAQVVNLVCPKCKSTGSYELRSDGSFNIRCNECGSAFQTVIATVRAKKSRGSRRNEFREFDVRLRYSDGQEEFVQFDKPGFEDFELRQGDLAAFTSYKGKLRIVENLTIRQYLDLSREEGCFIQLLKGVVGIIIFLLLIGFILSFFKR